MTRSGMRIGARSAILALGFLAAAVLGPAGCKSAASGEKRSGGTNKPVPESPYMADARAHLAAGRYNEALLALAAQSRENPGAPGLEDLRTAALDKLVETRAGELKPAIPVHETKMDQEVDAGKKLPDSYGARRIVVPPASVIRTPNNAAETMLQLPVSLSLEGADLTAFIMGLTQSTSASTNTAINIIADNSLAAGQTLTISVTNVPLREVLEFAGRNLDVSFYVGESMIWCTKRQQAVDSVPMQTRVYKLRKGISSIEKAGDDGSGSSLIGAIEKFVPKSDGAELMFDRDSHVLIAKNTRDNLRLIEDLIDVLDVVPPQVLIEARFISTSVADLRELGVNWNVQNLDFRVGDHANPMATLKAGKIVNNGAVATPSLDATLAYQGLLTTPMFELIIQALEKSGKSQTLSVPRVTTLNNQLARIRVGEDFLYFENFTLQQVPTTPDSNNNQQYVSQLVPTGEPTKEELGISLEVTPSVGADRQSVTLKLKPEINEFVRFENYQVAAGNSGASTATATNTGLSVLKLPIFRKSEVETRVAVRSGDTVVMGGLITSATVNEQIRVPFLGSLPLIGVLFRHDLKRLDQKNLLIFVTARILAETGEELVPLYTPEPAASVK